MNRRNLLTVPDAHRLARHAHRGQRYGVDDYYDAHLAPVADYVRLSLDSTWGLGFTHEEAQVAAVLHDVIEDTWVTLDYLAACGASAVVLSAVESVTRRPGEPYMQMIARARVDALGRVVKLADNLFNLAASQREGSARVERYTRARAVLLADDTR